MSRRPLVIVGAGGHGREVLDIVEALEARAPRFELLGFLDDRPRAPGASVRGLPVLGGVDWLATVDRRPLVVVAVGSSAARWRVTARLRAYGVEHPMLVHPTAQLTRGVSLAPGVVIAAGAILTTDIVLGAHTHVNVGATISHDARVEDFVTVGPGSHLAGSVQLGEGNDLGVGVVAVPGVEVGPWCIVGAGTVLVRQTPANVTVAGVPGRVIRQHEPGWQLTG